MVLQVLIAALVVLPVVSMVVGVMTGRAEVRSCCAVPAERDLRMRSAYVESPCPGALRGDRSAS